MIIQTTVTYKINIFLCGETAYILKLYNDTETV